MLKVGLFGSENIGVARDGAAAFDRVRAPLAMTMTMMTTIIATMRGGYG